MVRISAIALAATALLAAPGLGTAQSHVPRALYWNTAPYQGMSRATIDAAIAELKAQHIDRAHLWVNDQPTFVTCATLFTSPGWPGTVLEDFVKKLQAAGLGVVLTISPGVPTQAYIGSLQGVWGVAKRTGAEVEYDMEGNWAGWGPQTCGPGGTKPDLPAMELALIHATRAAAPDVKVGISIQPQYYKAHATLVAEADWVAPQLYTMRPVQMAASVKTLEDTWKAKSVWISVRVDTDLEGLGQQLIWAQTKAPLDPKVRGLVIWGRTELAWADKWLRRTQ